MEDLEAARRHVRPTVMRSDADPAVSSVAWDGVRGLDEAKRILEEHIIEPLLHPDDYEGYEIPSGVLFSGPPGTGKTHLARALASRAGINFIEITPEMLRGDPENAIAQIFERARQAAPAILFIDEFDAIGQEREFFDRGGTRLVSALLRQLNGASELKNVVLVAATNRPFALDRALKRSRRIALEIPFELPKLESRRDIFEGQRDERWDDAVDTGTLADQTDGWNSADIIEAVNEARRLRGKARAPKLTMEHLEAAIGSIAQQKAAKEPRKMQIGFVKDGDSASRVGS